MDRERHRPQVAARAEPVVPRPVRWLFVLLGAAGCAGRLTVEEDVIVDYFDAGRGATATSDAGAIGVVDPCIVDTGALKACQTVSCHSPDRVGGVQAGLDLSIASVTTNARSFLDRPNVGTMGVTMLGDDLGCPAGAFELIDSSNPTNSLLYTKTEPPGSARSHPCGMRMPVIGTFTPDHKACILRWIESVIALR